MAELVKGVAVKISTTGYEDAKLKIDRLTLAADKLKAEKPEITPQINSAKALIEARLLRDAIKKELAGSLNTGGGGGGLGGFLGFLSGSGAGKGAPGFLGAGGSAGGGIPGFVGIGAGITALLPELNALLTGFAAAGAGLTAFGVLAIPTFKKIETAYTGITGAQQKYNAAVALQKEDPTKTHAKDVANALTALRVAQEGVTGGTKTAVSGIQQLVSTYENMAKAFAPDALKVFNAALKIANTLLPDLKPFATVAGNAIDGLLGKVNTFFKGADFKKWLGSFQQYVGPSITAIGAGIGKVVTSIGKLLTGISVKDVVHGIASAFDILAAAIDAVAWTVKALMKVYNSFSASFEIASGRILGFFSQVVQGAQTFADAVLTAFGAVIHASRVAFDAIGLHFLDGVDKTFQGVRKSVHDNLGTAAKDLQQWGNDMSRAPKIFKLRGDITDLQTKLRNAQQDLKNPDLTRTRQIYLKGVISQLEEQIARAKADIASLQGKNVYITTFYNTVGRPTGQPRAQASGGASPGGPTRLNEQGPEIVDLPRGSYVHTAAQTLRMLGGGSGGGVQRVELHISGADREFVTFLKRIIRGNGGDPNVVGR